MKRSIIVTLVATNAISLAACGSDSGSEASDEKPDHPAVKAGQCVGAELADGASTAPDPTTVVDCTKPHLQEIAAAEEVPKEYLAKGSESAQLERRTELGAADKPTTLATKFQDWALSMCRPAVAEMAGLDKVTVAGKPATDVMLPPGSAVPATTLSQPAAWTDGSAQVVCSIRYTAAADGTSDTARPVTSTDSKPLISRLLTADYPAELRHCGAYEAVGAGHAEFEAVACDKAHQDEFVLSLDARDHVDPSQRAAVEKDGGVDFELHEGLFDACTDAAESIGIDPKDFHVAALFDLDVPPGQPIHVKCWIANKDSKKSLPAGSVFP